MKQLRIFIILFIAKSQSLKVYDEDLHIHLNISNGAEKKFGSSVQNRLGRTTVSCGNHKASNCGECGNKYWCNGDCRWVHGQCEVNTGTVTTKYYIVKTGNVTGGDATAKIQKEFEEQIVGEQGHTVNKDVPCKDIGMMYKYCPEWSRMGYCEKYPGHMLRKCRKSCKVCTDTIDTVNGAWSSWGSWSSCNAQSGKKKRTRHCNNPPPKNGGASCSGSSSDEASCKGVCHKPMAENDGWCNSDIWTFNKSSGLCEYLAWGGCWSENIFQSEEECSQTCVGRNCNCGRGMSMAEFGEISGGKKAPPTAFPWIVRLAYGCPRGVCAGTLVSPKVVLSAFHCTVPISGPYNQPCDHSDGKRLAILGTNVIHHQHLHTYEKIPVIQVLAPPHAPLYKYDDRTDDHDFALLVLQCPAKFNYKVSPICLPEPNAEFGGQKAIAAGWGRFAKPSVSTRQSPYLRMVKLSVSPKRYNHTKMFGTVLSMKEDEYQDPCAGDP